MNGAISHWLEAFARLKVLVLGEAILESCLEGYTQRLCREAPVPLVNLSQRNDTAGGAAHTAASVSGLEAQAMLLAVTGSDAEGERFKQSLSAAGLSGEHLLTHPTRPTLTKQRIMASGQMLLRLDQGETQPLDPNAEQTLIDRLTELFPQADALIVADHNKGLLTPAVIRAVAAFQAQTPRLVAVVSRCPAAYQQVNAALMVANYEPIADLLGLDRLADASAWAEQLTPYAGQLPARLGAQIAAVNLGPAGWLVCEQNQTPYRANTPSLPPAQAGRTSNIFISALTLALTANIPTPTAVELAAVAAMNAAHRNGVGGGSTEALPAAAAPPAKYLPRLADLREQLALYRQQGRRIVMTNGCFDILHRGHITYLNRARALGDLLIVGLNADESIRRLKGPQRPINRLEDRAQVLAALDCVDHVVPFYEDTPCRLVEVIRPDVFVKGGDYTRATLPEAPLVESFGGVVEILPYLQDFSTTHIIERIQETSVQPANGPFVAAT